MGVKKVNKKNAKSKLPEQKKSNKLTKRKSDLKNSKAEETSTSKNDSKNTRSKNDDQKSKSSFHDMKKFLSDPRFAHIAKDPRFKDASEKDLKIQLDDRFKSVLKDKKFSIKDHLDPRGRPRNFASKKSLDEFYESDPDTSESESSDQDENASSEEEEEELSTEENDDREKGKENFLQILMDPEKDMARGDLLFSDDSSDDDSTTTDEDDEEENFGEFEWGEWDKDAQWDCDGFEVEETHRFAVCDMDWDRIKAVDLMVLFSSFTPPAGAIKKVTIYPSDFGKARIQEEEESGPQELVRLAAGCKKNAPDELDDLEKIKKGTYNETTEASAIHIEALRRYQRNRLKYYYAVVECDSVDTAKAIYKECDRSSFDVVGVTLDLRYIPSDMEFDEIPHDECFEVPSNYVSEKAPSKPLQEAKPTLTWDETDHRRTKTLSTVMSKALRKEHFDEDALRDYVGDSDDADDLEIGSDAESSDDGKEDRIKKFRSLISEIEGKDRKKKDDAFWNADDAFETASANDENEEKDVDEEEEEENSDKDGSSDNEKLTPFEQYLTKRKEKRKMKKKMRNTVDDKDDNGDSDNDDSDNGDSDNDDSDNDDSDNQKGKTKKKSKSKKLGKKVPNENENYGLSLLVMNEEEEDRKHFNLRKVREEKKKNNNKKKDKNNKKKNKNKETDSVNTGNLDNIEKFQVDWADPRFSALFNAGSFHVDPSHPKYDPTVSMGPGSHGARPSKRPKMETMVKSTQDSKKSIIDGDVSQLVNKLKMKTRKKPN